MPQPAPKRALMSPRTTMLGAAALLAAFGAAALRLPRQHDAEVVPAVRVLAAAQAVGVAVRDQEPAQDAAPLTVFPILRATTPAEVREVLRITKAAGTRDVPALRHAALHAEDALVVGNAVKALGRLRAFAADAELLALTADDRLRVRQNAVVACGLDGDAAAIPHLERALAAGEASLRPLVLEALGRIGGPQALALVERIAVDPAVSQIDRVFARVALAKMPGGR